MQKRKKIGLVLSESYLIPLIRLITNIPNITIVVVTPWDRRTDLDALIVYSDKPTNNNTGQPAGISNMGFPIQGDSILDTFFLDDLKFYTEEIKTPALFLHYGIIYSTRLLNSRWQIMHRDLELQYKNLKFQCNKQYIQDIFVPTKELHKDLDSVSIVEYVCSHTPIQGISLDLNLGAELIINRLKLMLNIENGNYDIGKNPSSGGSPKTPIIPKLPKGKIGKNRV